VKNLIITLDEEVAHWAMIRAAQRHTNVSRLVGEMLREKMLEEQSYRTVMQEYLSRPPKKLKRPGVRYPRREELHGR